jgi:hypothetical protein
MFMKLVVSPSEEARTPADLLGTSLKIPEPYKAALMAEACWIGTGLPHRQRLCSELVKLDSCILTLRHQFSKIVTTYTKEHRANFTSCVTTTLSPTEECSTNETIPGHPACGLLQEFMQLLVLVEALKMVSNES